MGSAKTIGLFSMVTKTVVKTQIVKEQKGYLQRMSKRKNKMKLKSWELIS